MPYDIHETLYILYIPLHNSLYTMYMPCVKRLKSAVYI